MNKDLLNQIEREFFKEAKEVILKSSKEAKGFNLNSIDTLAYVYNKINEYFNSLKNTIIITKKMKDYVLELEEPIVNAAKQEFSDKISAIILKNSPDMLREISDFVEELSEKGINFGKEFNSNFSIPNTTREQRVKFEEPTIRVSERPVLRRKQVYREDSVGGDFGCGRSSDDSSSCGGSSSGCC